MGSNWPFSACSRAPALWGRPKKFDGMLWLARAGKAGPRTSALQLQGKGVGRLAAASV